MCGAVKCHALHLWMTSSSFPIVRLLLRVGHVVYLHQDPVSGAGKMAQGVKALSVQVGELNLIPGLCTGRRELTPQSCPLPPYTLCGICNHPLHYKSSILFLNRISTWAS